jgi:hypothetical protein
MKFLLRYIINEYLDIKVKGEVKMTIKVMQIKYYAATEPGGVTTFLNRIDKPCPGLMAKMDEIVTEVRTTGQGYLDIRIIEMEEDKYESITKI